MTPKSNSMLSKTHISASAPKINDITNMICLLEKNPIKNNKQKSCKLSLYLQRRKEKQR